MDRAQLIHDQRERQQNFVDCVLLQQKSTSNLKHVAEVGDPQMTACRYGKTLQLSFFHPYKFMSALLCPGCFRCFRHLYVPQTITKLKIAPCNVY